MNPTSEAMLQYQDMKVHTDHSFCFPQVEVIILQNLREHLLRYSSNGRSLYLHNHSSRSYKLPHLKLGKFKGEYCSGLIRQFERMAANEGWTEEDILNTFSYCLKDEA
jgi:hypothetical protein